MWGRKAVGPLSQNLQRNNDVKEKSKKSYTLVSGSKPLVHVRGNMRAGERRRDHFNERMSQTVSGYGHARIF